MESKILILPIFLFFVTFSSEVNADCTAPNCEACMPNEAAKCKTCNKGYRLEGTACEACTGANCGTCPDAANTCATCKAEAMYILTDKSDCKACGENCNACDKETCTTCKLGFELKDKACSKCSIAKCKTYATNKCECSACQENYTASKDKKTCSGIDNLKPTFVMFLALAAVTLLFKF